MWTALRDRNLQVCRPDAYQVGAQIPFRRFHARGKGDIESAKAATRRGDSPVYERSSIIIVALACSMAAATQSKRHEDMLTKRPSERF